MNIETKKKPGGTCKLHKKRQQLVNQAQAANAQYELTGSTADLQLASDLSQEAQRLPMFLGKGVTPKGEVLSVALYVPEDSDSGLVYMSFRPWKERTESIHEETE